MTRIGAMLIFVPRDFRIRPSTPEDLVLQRSNPFLQQRNLSLVRCGEVVLHPHEAKLRPG
jgi:hypothetical protein